jgi:putative metallohydrolase (TIGR04338 family)
MAALPRDAQRARVYRAELPLPSSPLPGLTACQAFADRVVGTLWWHARFPHLTLDRLPPLRAGRGARTAFFDEADSGSVSITLPRGYWTKGVVLHELAHWALHDQRDLPAHGATFARLMLDCTEEFCGAERAAVLAAAYRAERVRVAAPPRRGPDGHWRYGTDERLRLSLHQPVVVRAGTETRVSGVLEAWEQRGSVLVLRTDRDTRRVDAASVWAVEAAR